MVKKKLPIQGFEMGKLPPQHLELEEAVLGAILLDSTCLLEISDVLTTDCFYKEANRAIYEKVMLPLYRDSKPIDLLVVAAEMKKAGILKSCGGAYYLTELTSKITGTSNVQEYALILKQAAIKRNLINICSEVINDAYDDGSDSLSLLDKASVMISDISIKSIGKRFKSIKEVISSSIKEVEEMAKKDVEITGIPSGFWEIDKLTAGWQRGELIIIASRPSMGKTTFALNIASFAAKESNRAVAFFSLEMSNAQIGKKMISAETSIPLNKIKVGKLDDNEWDGINTQIGKLVSSKFFINDTAAISIFELKTKLRKLKYEHPELDIAVIDYLQLMDGADPANRNQTREQQIGYISRNLKAIAKELDITIVALSQLSRAVEARGGDKKPILADLRESGSIEADADIVMFLYRPEYYKIFKDNQGNDLRGKALVIIAKHRNGALGDIKLEFEGKLSTFSSINAMDVQGITDDGPF